MSEQEIIQTDTPTGHSEPNDIELSDNEAELEDETCPSTKKKRNRRKKKKQPITTEFNGHSKDSLNENILPEQDNSVFRRLQNWPEEKPSKQTDPPTIPIDQIYKGKPYPIGELHEYNKNSGHSRTTESEKRHIKIIETANYDDIRRAAECHRQVRKFAQSYIRPGLSMTEICTKLEAKVDQLISHKGLESGRAFPTGCSLNNCAAHYSPNPGDTRILQQGDICKIDFGVHVNGHIVDSAFTLAFEPHFDNLVQASIEGTRTGIQASGIDARMYEIGAAIQETIESFECEIDGITYPIKPIRNLTGHSIAQYEIHGGKSVPICKVKHSENAKMEEGEVFAIETFASTGKGYVIDAPDCSHYRKMSDVPYPPLRLKSAKDLLKAIETNFGSLPFCRRWLDDLGQTRHIMALKSLVENRIVDSYPPLCDIKGSYTSQNEHTIILHPNCKEVVSKGFDY